MWFYNNCLLFDKISAKNVEYYYFVIVIIMQPMPINNNSMIMKLPTQWL